MQDIVLPVLRKNNVICHFAHIPKCGGTSVEDYCKKTGIKIAFLDDTYISVPAPQKWNISSPQHIDGYSLFRLIPPDFFDICFTVVRDPVARFISAYNFQVESENQIAGKRDINHFIKNDLRQASQTLGSYDNHFLPQVKFLLPGTRYYIFRLEDGLENVKHYIDQKILGVDALPEIGRINMAVHSEDTEMQESDIDPEAITILRDIYKDDYKFFHYNNEKFRHTDMTQNRLRNSPAA